MTAQILFNVVVLYSQLYGLCSFVANAPVMLRSRVHGYDVGREEIFHVKEIIVAVCMENS